MVESADFRELYDLARRGELDRPEVWSILVEREMGTRPVVVGEVPGEEAVEISLAEYEDMIQALAPDRADEPLAERVLPRALRRREHLLDPHALHAAPELLAIDLVAITQEIAWGGVVWEGVDELLRGPGGGGVLGHVEVDDAPAVVGEDDEDEEDAEASGRHGEEVDRDQVGDVVSEERPPGLRRLGLTLRHEPGDGPLGDLDAELQKLSVDARGAPERIRGGHLPHEAGDLGIDAGATTGRPTGEPGPVLAEPTALPSEDGSGCHDNQCLPPPGPNPGQGGPEQAVGLVELRARRHSLVDGELLTQGQVLEGELAVAADKERQKPQHVECEGDHERRLWPDEADGSITCWPNEVLANHRGAGLREPRARLLRRSGVPRYGFSAGLRDGV